MEGYDAKTERHEARKSCRSWPGLVFLAFIAAFLLSAGADSARATMINPPCGTAVSGTTVTSDVVLTMDITCTDSNWITIGADNITVDLNGHIVTCTDTTTVGYEQSCQGLSDYGIYTNGHSNIRIMSSNEDEHGVIKGFDIGVLVCPPPSPTANPCFGGGSAGSNVKVEGLTITGPHGIAGVNMRPLSAGVALVFVGCGQSTDLSDDKNLVVKISENRVSNQTYGIFVRGSSCVKVQDNTVFNSNSDINESHGILLTSHSSKNKVYNNMVFGNGENLMFDGGLTILDSSNNLIRENEVSDNNGDGISLRDDTGGTSTVGNTVQDNEMLFNGDPLSGMIFYDAAERGATPVVNTWKDNECITESTGVPAGACKEDESTKLKSGPPNREDPTKAMFPR
jgi:parallel beta-helix repeat protein